MENRSAFFLVGILFIVAGIMFVPFLCGTGVLFIIIGAIMWARD